MDAGPSRRHRKYRTAQYLTAIVKSPLSVVQKLKLAVYVKTAQPSRKKVKRLMTEADALLSVGYRDEAILLYALAAATARLSKSHHLQKVLTRKLEVLRILQ